MSESIKRADKRIVLQLFIALLLILLAFVYPVMAADSKEGNVSMVVSGVNITADTTVADWGFTVSTEPAVVHHETWYPAILKSGNTLTVTVNLKPGYSLQVDTKHKDVEVKGGVITVSNITGGVDISIKVNSGFTVILDDYTYGNAPESPRIEPEVPEGCTVNYYYSFSLLGEGKKWSQSEGNKLDALTKEEIPYYIYAVVKNEKGEIETARSEFRVTKAPGIVPSLISIDVSAMPVVVVLDGKDCERELEYSLNNGVSWTRLSREELTAGLFSIQGLQKNTRYTLQLRSCESRNYYASAPFETTFKTPDITPVYLLSYNANNGVGSPDPVSVKEGEEIEVDAGLKVSRPGYAFAGWYTKSAGGEKIEGRIQVTRNMTLYAHWDISPYTIEFDANGGSGSLSPLENIKITDTVEFPKNSGQISREDYDFLGWSRSSNGNVVYKNGSKGIAPEPDSTNQKVTLYAVWGKLKEHKVTGDVEGDKGKHVDISIKYGNILLSKIENVILDTETGKCTYEYTVPDGVYDIVVETRDYIPNIIVTRMVVVNGASVTVETIHLPDSGANSIVTVHENTPQAVVGNLDAEAEVNRESGKYITMELSVKSQTEKELPDDVEFAEEEADIQNAIQDIKKVAVVKNPPDTTIDFISLDLTKKSIDSLGVITENPVTITDTVLEIVIPFDMGGKADITVYRKHGDSVDVFEEKDTKEDGTFKLDRKNGLIYIYTKKFSVYGIGYLGLGKNSYNLTYKPGIGSGNPWNDSVCIGSSIILPKNMKFTPPSDDMEFDGWKVGENDKVYYAGDKLTPEDDLDIVAQWKNREEWKVSFDANGGSGSMDSITVKKGDSLNLPKSRFTAPSGMQFHSWVINGVSYGVGEKFTPTADVTAYASWQSIGGGGSSPTVYIGEYRGENIYTFDRSPVVYKLEVPDGSDISSNVTITPKSTTNGWYSFELSAPGYKDGEKGNVWFMVPVSELTQKGFDTGDVQLQTANGSCDTYYLSTDGEYAYYRAEIFSDELFTIQFVKNGSIVSQIIDPQEDKKWSYEVKFDTLGKAINPPNQVVAAGTAAVKPADPQAAWFIFPSWWILEGWVDSSTGKMWNFSTDAVLKDTTLYAQWIFPWWWIVLAILITAGIIALIVYLVKREKKEKQKMFTEK